MSLLGPYVCVSWAIRKQSGFLAGSVSAGTAHGADTRMELPLKQSLQVNTNGLVLKEAFRSGGKKKKG